MDENDLLDEDEGVNSSALVAKKWLEINFNGVTGG